jgi:hypothetical protein
MCHACAMLELYKGIYEYVNAIIVYMMLLFYWVQEDAEI